jgi:pyruvate dehydrogenase E1 component
MLVATTIPNCRAYDPCYGYELAVIIQDGLRRMYKENESIFYYIACMNENYVQPAMPEGVEAGIVKGMYRLQSGGRGKIRVQLMGSGTILREVLAAAEMLEREFQVPADVWSVTSFSELRREAMSVDRWNERHPEKAPRESYLESSLKAEGGPYIAATDNIKLVPDQIRQWVPGTYRVLGTDGFGRSDSRAALRDFFEVDRRSIVVAALKALVDDEALDVKTVASAIAKYRIDPEKPDPVSI